MSATKQALNSAERKKQILAATLEIFAEAGLAKTTIANISTASGASVGSIYHHFGDREGVLFGLYQESFQDCFSQLSEAVLAEKSAQAGIFALVTNYLDWISANPVRGRFIYETSGGDILRHHHEEIVAFKTALYTKMVGWMLPFIQTGDVIMLPPWAYDAIIMGPAHEFARRWLAGWREMALEEAKEIIAGAIWRAIQLQ